MPSVGGVKEITDYFQAVRLRYQSAGQRFRDGQIRNDMDTLSFLLAPFIASLILTGIHAYLGVHVVERGVIFVDLSLAQIAALGTTIAVLVRIRSARPWVATGSAWLFTFHGRGGVLHHSRAQGAHSAGGDDRHLLRGGVGGGDSGHEQVGRADRAPEGNAGGQHPDRLLA